MQIDVAYEKHVLPNGLEVVLHQDRSAPLVAVFVYYHVGSSHEDPGRSGFAHLFEHMLFQGSRNVGDDEHFRAIQEAGGTLNGTTNQDRTNYYEVLPSNQLELALWLESDRMGYLLPAMTDKKLQNQRDVVKNERRQSYENRPYGLVYETLLAQLYPPGHPYSWPTIGSMEHIEAATLDDIADFFQRFYGPNNATLAIGGDFDPAGALALVRRWFGALPRGPAVGRPTPWSAALDATRAVVLEDRIQLPQLTLAWPTVHAWHPDEAPLDLLGDVLSANRSSILDRVLIVEEELASEVMIAHRAGERAGFLQIDARPRTGVALDTLARRIDELVAGVSADGVDPQRLERLMARREGALLRSLETVAGRTSALGRYNCFRGDPGQLAVDLERFRRVTPDDVRAAAERYLLGRPRIVLSTVPRGRADLAVSGERLEAETVTAARDAAAAQPDRAHRPPPGPAPRFGAPELWRAGPPNGIRIAGTTFDELPLARFSLSLPAGRFLETPETCGLASLVAALLEEGTRRLSGTELTDAIDGLGATLDVRATDEEIAIGVTVPNEHLAEVAGLVEELLKEPRFDPRDFERVRAQRLLAIRTRSDRIRDLAADAFVALVHGDDDPRGAPALGTERAVTGLACADLERFWREHAIRDRARLSFVGSAAVFERTFRARTGRSAAPTSEARLAAVEEPPRRPRTIRLLDKPGAPQSEIRIGHEGVARTDPDWFPAYALNWVLGGSFSSRINLNLRERRGYTYGARSSFEGGLLPGELTVATAVETRHTAPAVVEIVRELEGMLEGPTPAEVDFVRRALVQSLYRSYESMAGRLAYVENVSKYGYPEDYPVRRRAWLEALEPAELRALALRRLRPDALVLCVVGDAAAVEPELRALPGFGVERIDDRGRPLGG